MRPPVLLVVVAPLVAAINNGLGRAPLMGWSTWCTDGSCGRDVCNEAEIHDVAQALIDSGLQAAGWNAVAMDDCWENDARDATGQLQADPLRFPSGMRSLTDWLHARGFLAGTYISLGYDTCNPSGHAHKVPGSYPYYPLDAHTLVVDWGFDYIKGDWCDWQSPVPLDIGNSTTWMAASLNATGVPNRFGFHGIAGVPWTTASGNYARVFSDHHDQWTSGSLGEDGTGDIIGLAALWSPGASAGAQPAELGGGWWYPDFDFLMTGGQGCNAAPNATVHCPGQTDTEYATEFIFWSMSNSVLLFSTDPRNLTDIMQQALFNSELIALNQAGGQGVLLKTLTPCSGGSGRTLPQPCQVWARSNATSVVFAIVYNPNAPGTGDAQNVVLKFADVGLAPSALVFVRDMWLHHEEGGHTGTFSVATLPGHGAVPLHLTVQQQQVE
jgi:alpha-galactosidase